MMCWHLSRKMQAMWLVLRLSVLPELGLKPGLSQGKGRTRSMSTAKQTQCSRGGFWASEGVWVDSCRRKSYSTEMSVWGGFLPAPSSRQMAELGFIQPNPGPPSCVGSLDDQQEDESSLCQTAVQDEWAGLSSGYVCLLLSLRRV